MEANLNQERQQAHALLDMLSAQKLNAVRSLLEVMVEPLVRSLAFSAVEDEEVTDGTAAALDRARASLARGVFIGAVAYGLIEKRIAHPFISAVALTTISYSIFLSDS